MVHIVTSFVSLEKAPSNCMFVCLFIYLFVGFEETNNYFENVVSEPLFPDG